MLIIGAEKRRLYDFFTEKAAFSFGQESIDIQFFIADTANEDFVKYFRLYAFIP